MSRSIAASALIGAALALAVGLAVWVINGSPASVPKAGVRVRVLNDPEPVFITVAPGDTAGTIAGRLEDASVIDNASSFRFLAKFTGAERSLAAGEYEFARGTSVLDALGRMQKGLTSARIVTIPEGLRLEEIGALLEKRGIVSSSDLLAAANAYAAKNGASLPLLATRPAGASLEGYLYPATYGFSPKVSAQDVVELMVKALDERFPPALREEARQKGLSVHQTLVLASIVEREVVVPEERPLVASVYLNRLAQGTLLQADPTVQYAVASRASVAQNGYWKRELSAEDLQSGSPYNTYVKTGLPPGPIANPGIDSIIAVIRPAQTSYLYFVARPDGSHAFSTTFEEHERNVQKYQR